MEREIEATSTDSSIYGVLIDLTRNAISVAFSSIERETLEVIACVTFAVVGASSYIYHKIKDNDVKFSAKRNRIRKEKSFENHDVRKSISCFYDKNKQNSFEYRKVLTELHNSCDNCSNIFNSMKCIQLTADYPELINVALHTDGVTPFHRVCSRGNELLMEYMLAKGADPGLRTVAGENALCKAIYHVLFTGSEDFKCLNLLERNGCSFGSNDEWYEIFLKLAVKYKNKKLAEWLIAHSKSRIQRSGFIRAPSAPL